MGLSIGITRRPHHPLSATSLIINTTVFLEINSTSPPPSNTYAGIAITVCLALLVVRRLFLMRRHWAALALYLSQAATNSLGVSNAAPTCPASDGRATAVTVDVSGPSAAAATEGPAARLVSGVACGGNGGEGSGDCGDVDAGCGFRVVEAGAFLLGLELASMMWVVDGWSSLVALRFRYDFSPVLFRGREAEFFVCVSALLSYLQWCGFCYL